MFVSCCSARKDPEVACTMGGETVSYLELLSSPPKKPKKKSSLGLEVARRILSFVSYKEWHALSLVTRETNRLIPCVKWQKTTEDPVVWKNFAWVIYRFPRHLNNPALQKHYTDRWMLRIFGSSHIPLQLPCVKIETKEEELGGFSALDDLWRKKESFFGAKETQIFQATWQSFVPKAVLVWKVTILWPKKQETGPTILDVWHDYLLFDWDIYKKRWEVRHHIGEEGRPDYSYQRGSSLIPKERRQYWVDQSSLSWIQPLLQGKLVGAKVDLRRRVVRDPNQVIRYFQDFPMCLGHVSIKHLLDRMSIQTEEITIRSQVALHRIVGLVRSKERAIVYRF